MSNEDMRALAQEIVRALFERIGAPTVTPPQAPVAEPVYMTVAEYARRIGFGRTTVQNWVREGLPSVKSTRGRRVNIKAADSWLQAGGARRSMDS